MTYASTECEPPLSARDESATLTQAKNETLVLGDYVLEERIGAGGMGMVFRARHRRMQRTVALKLLPPNACLETEAIKRFQREAVAAAQLNHPNIVAAYDAGEARGIHYLVMEYVEGENLAELVERRGPLSVGLALSCLRQAAVGLAYAHQRGVIHRDIKPSNLMLVADTETGSLASGDRRAASRRLKVLDMGIAHFDNPNLEAGGALTHTGAFLGTVDYMSPEQALDTKSADARSDIYSLGCTLYYLLTGRAMYAGDSLMKRLLAHREAPIPLLAVSRERLPRQLREVFERMVAKRPEERYASMEEVNQALAACQAECGEPPADERPNPPRADETHRPTHNSGSCDPTWKHQVPPVNPARRNYERLRALAHVAALLFAIGMFAISRHLNEKSQVANRKMPLEALPSAALADTRADESSIVSSDLPAETLSPSPREIPADSKMPPASDAQVLENSLGMKLVLVPASSTFYLGKHEVTQREYLRVMGKNPSWFSRAGAGNEQVALLDTGRLPVDSVSWEDAREFCRRLSALPEEANAGRVYRLPTEVEWEFACRAGTKTAFHFGDAANGSQANCCGNSPVGTTVTGPYLGRTTAVGSYQPNAFGLYDMHGNVWEWCDDYFGDIPLAFPGSGKQVRDERRVIRGGSWLYLPYFCRTVSRDGFGPLESSHDGGFRVACDK